VLQGTSDPILRDPESEVSNAATILERLALGSLLPVGPREVPTPQISPADAERAVVLRLEELVTDEAGNVHVSVGSGLRTLVLETAAQLVASGTVAATDAQPGGSSSELVYLKFEIGITVYVPAELDLVLTVPTG